ncbi:hypothetical protein AGRO_0185 [Agrobacterium sp. ATCC 31749]|jgi:hypothetical protein|nr:hypothetical protein AGRO_0185 [Agrobacterium sp. ATCC 31749]
MPIDERGTTGGISPPVDCGRFNRRTGVAPAVMEGHLS